MDDEDKELFYQAARAWQLHCESRGYRFSMPSQSKSETDGTTVYLRSTNGDVAMYDIASKSISEPEQIKEPQQ